MKTESFEKFGSEVSVGASRFSFLHDKMRETTVKMHKYLSTETEIFSRIMEMRYVLGETVENLNANYVRLPRGIEMAQKSRAYNDLRRVLGHEQIEKLYNNLPAMLPVGTLAGLQGQLDNESEVLESVEKLMNKIENISVQEEALQLAKKDLISFGKLFLPDDFLRSETPPFHYEVADTINNPEKNKWLSFCLVVMEKLYLPKPLYSMTFSSLVSHIFMDGCLLLKNLQQAIWIM